MPHVSAGVAIAVSALDDERDSRMKKWLVCCLCLLSSGVWAQEEEVLPDAEPFERAPALWIQPLPVLLLPVGLLDFDVLEAPSTWLVLAELPLGLTVPVGPRQDLVFELTPFYQYRVYDVQVHSKALYASVGSAWSPSPDRHGQGWFIQPKLLGVVAAVKMDEVHLGVTVDQRSAQLSLGLDVGYRVSSERLFLEFVLGLSAGYGWNVPTHYRSVIEFAVANDNYFEFSKGYTNKVVWDYNLNVLRLGFRF